MDSEPTAPANRRPATSGVWRWQAPTAAHLQEMLPQYEVLEVLGQGGMGAVYKARQKSLRRLVAIKVLPLDALDDESQYVQRFRNEAYTLAQLSHPGIVSVYDFGETTEGQLYFVMEFVDGTDLAQLLYANGRMPLRDALRVAIHVCDALTYAHAQGVIHRDIKPANVLIDRAGDVKVADFGLAKARHESQSQTLTRSQTAMGTPDYVAPEVLSPRMVADHRADLYAVGVMLYQMLTGEVPRGMFKLPSQKVPGLDIRLDEIVCRAMEQDLSDRFQTAASMRQAFDDILTTSLAKQQTAKDEPKSAAPTARRSLRIAAAGIVALLAAGALALKQGESSPRQMPAAVGNNGSPNKSYPKPNAEKAAVLGEPSSFSGPSSNEPQKLSQTIGRTINLLPLVDLGRDAFRGTWSRSAAGISVADPSGVTVLQLPYRPPEEYDFEIEFTADGDGMNVNQYVSVGGRPVAWKLNSHHVNPPLYGFDLLDQKFAKEFAEAATRLTEGIEKGRRYKSKLEIRRGSIRALLDDKEILHWAGDFKRFSIEDHSRMSDDLHIGIGSWRRAVTFHKVQVTEISGPGQIDASVSEKAAWRDWLAPRLEKGQFAGKGWIAETGGLTTDQALRGEAVLPAATRDGAVRLSYTLRNSEGGSVTFRGQGGGAGRAYYTGYDTGKTLFLSRNLNGEQLRLASESIPPEISAVPERTLEVRFIGNRMTATLNGLFTITAIDDALAEGECAMVLAKGALLKNVETLALETLPPWQWLSTKPEDFGKNLKHVNPQCVMFRDKILFLTQKTLLAKEDSCQGAIRAITRYFEGRTGSVTVRASEDVPWGEESFAAAAWISGGGASVTLSVHHPNQTGTDPDKHVFPLHDPVVANSLFSMEMRIEKKQITVIVNGQQAGAVEDPAAGTRRLFGVMPPLTDFGEYREIAWQRLPDSP